MPTGKRARWILTLQQYDFKIKHRSGKTNTNADALSRISEQEASCFMLNVSNAFNENESKREDDEWVVTSNSSEVANVINLNEAELIEWYYTRNICEDCGIPEASHHMDDRWNAPKLCNICYEHRERQRNAILQENPDWDRINGEYQSAIIIARELEDGVKNVEKLID